MQESLSGRIDELAHKNEDKQALSSRETHCSFLYSVLCSGALRVPRKVNLSILMAKKHGYVGNGILYGDQVGP